MRKLAVVFGIVIGLALGVASIAEANVWRSPISGDGTMVQQLKAAFGLTVGGGTAVSKILRASHTADVASIAANACAADLSVTVTGATVTSECIVGMPSSASAGVQGTCFVSGTDGVKIRLCNNSGSASDPPSATYWVRVFVP